MLKHKSVTFAHDSGCAKENDFRANLRTDRFNRCATRYNPRTAARSKAKTSSFPDREDPKKKGTNKRGEDPKKRNKQERRGPQKRRSKQEDPKKKRNKQEDPSPPKKKKETNKRTSPQKKKQTRGPPKK